MIYTEMYGGMGNQMFNYSFSRTLQLETGQPLAMRVQLSDKNGIGNYNLDKFAICECSVSEINGRLGFREYHKKFGLDLALKRVFMKLFLNYSNRRFPGQTGKRKRFEFCRKVEPLLNYMGIMWGYDGYQPVRIHKRKNYFISGSFISPRYLKKYEGIIKSELHVKTIPDERNKRALDLIASYADSVCIHVRRGDYLTKENKRAYDVCSPRYYERAVNYCDTHLHSPHYFVFSNDISWAKEHLGLRDDIEYMEINSEQAPAEELRLMYSCNNFIIANSTFSWWAQFLSDNKNKLVISPKRFFNIDIPCDLIDESWIQLDTE